MLCDGVPANYLELRADVFDDGLQLTLYIDFIELRIARS